jgi:hypothetical protein
MQGDVSMEMTGTVNYSGTTFKGSADIVTRMPQLKGPQKAKIKMSGKRIGDC